VGKFALIVPVIGLDLFARDHHQVGHFVNDHNDIGQFLGRVLFSLENRLARVFVKSGLHGAFEILTLLQRFGDAAIVAFDVAHAHLGHFAITFFHLAHGPFQRHQRLFGVGHDGAQQMRDAVIDRQFEHLGVDHDHAAFFGRQFIEQRQDHRVDGHGFTGPGGPRDQQVWHLGEVRHDRFAADILAQGQRQAVVAIAEFTTCEDFAQHDLFAVLVGQFDADHAAARHGGDTGRQGGHGARDVIGQTDHAAGFQTGRGFEFIHRHHGTRAHGDDLAFDAIVIQHGFQHARVFFQRFIRQVQARHGIGAFQQGKRRQFETGVRVLERQGGLGLGLQRSER